MKKLGAIGVVLLALLAGCGSAGESPADKAAASKSAADEQAAKDRADDAAKAKKEATAVFTECQTITADLDTAVSGINSRLTTGMQYAEYTKAVGDAVAVRDQLVKKAKAQGGISEECIDGVGTPLENAMLAYAKGGDIWGDCLDDYNCSFDKGSEALKKTQAEWTKAGKLVDKAETALAALQPS